jgi:hypothetical protein
MKNYRVYAKFKGQSKFKPIDLSQGTQVTNLIHATIIPDFNLSKLIDSFNQPQEDGNVVEIRCIEDNKTVWTSDIKQLVDDIYDYSAE